MTTLPEITANVAGRPLDEARTKDVLEFLLEDELAGLELPGKAEVLGFTPSEFHHGALVENHLLVTWRDPRGVIHRTRIGVLAG